MKTLFTLACMISGSLLGGPINLGNATAETVSFNGNPGTLTLGANDCFSGICFIEGAASISGLSLTWAFQTPDPTTITYSYSGSAGPLSDTNNPNGLFGLFDTNGDSVTGTFILTTLNGDGRTGIDINGQFSLINSSYTGNADSANFQTLFGVGTIPPNVNGTFTLDVGNCTAGPEAKPVNCIPAGSADPTAHPLNLTLDLPITASQVSESTTFALLGFGLCAISTRRWLSRY